MFNAVLTHFDTYAHLWEGQPHLASTVAALRDHLAELDAQAWVQRRQQPSVLTRDLQAQRQQIEATVIALGHRLRAFAQMESNHALDVATDFSPSRLRSASRASFLDLCERLHQRAGEHLEALGPYEVTQAHLDALREALDTYRLVTAQRDHAVSERVTATSSLPDLFADARAQLALLDTLVPGFVDDASFRNTYVQARRVLER